MAIPALESWVDDRSLYPLHEEDDVPEITRHESEVRNLRDVLSLRFRDRLVTGNVCIYWIPGEFQQYYAPDAFVTEAPPAEPEPRVYHIWQDPPIVFVAEVDSRSLTEAQRAHNFHICELVLCIPEFLDFDPEESSLRLWRLGPRGYEPVAPQPSGRVRSEELELDFGIDEKGRLRTYTLDGDVLPIYEEAVRDREAAEQRAAAEARQREEAERRAAAEARQREEAERRAAAEAYQREAAERARQAAEARAAEEARQRAALEREMAALREELSRRDTGGEDGGTAGRAPGEPDA